MNTAIILLIIFFVLIILGVIGYFIYKYYNTNKIQAPCPENDISNYNISDTPLKASELLQRIFTRLSIVMNRIREKFDLSPGTVTDVRNLVSGVFYQRGTLKSGVSNTVTGVKNGGSLCTEFPKMIYIPTASPPPPPPPPTASPPPPPPPPPPRASPPPPPRASPPPPPPIIIPNFKDIPNFSGIASYGGGR